MEANLTQRRSSLEEKIPDIKKTLSMVEFLHDRRVSARRCVDCTEEKVTMAVSLAFH